MERNADWFAKMYQDIYRDLYRFALYTLKNPQDAEDAVSQTVLDAWKGIHTLRRRESFRSWIFCILSAKCKQHWKDASTTAVELPENLSASERDPAEDMDVRAAFFRLDDEERLILSLHLFAGYKSREIARILGRREGTIRSRQSRALKKMEQMLTGQEES